MHGMFHQERLRRPDPRSASAERRGGTTHPDFAVQATAALPGYSYARSAPVTPLRLTDANDPMEHEADGVASAAAEPGARAARPSVSRARSSATARPLGTALTSVIEQQ